VLIEKNRKRILYTGDIQTQDSNLLKGAKLPDHADTLIMESTYSDKDHPPRKKEQNRFINEIKQALDLHETVLVPTFAVGRAQEVLLILEEFADQVALDGMAKTASEIILKYSHHLKTPKKLRKILNRVNWITTNKERETAIQEFPIIVTTAGMMSGGPVIYYLNELKEKHHAKILFTGYLIEDSPARILRETGVFKIAEEKYHVHCDIKQFDFSAHAGRTELFEIIEKTNPEKVIVMHGDNCENFAQEINNTYGITAIAPKPGDVIDV